MKKIIFCLFLGLFLCVGLNANPLDKAIDDSTEWVKELDVLLGDEEIPGGCARNYTKGDIRLKYFGSPIVHYIEIVDRKEHILLRYNSNSYKECMIIFNYLLNNKNPIELDESYIFIDITPK